MTQREISTTTAEDRAVEIFAKRDGLTEEEYFQKFVTQQMAQLVTGALELQTQDLGLKYREANASDRATIDGLLRR